MQTLKDATSSVGKETYQEFYERCHGKNFISGKPLPVWEKQSKAVRKAWTDAGQKMAESFIPAINLTVTKI